MRAKQIILASGGNDGGDMSLEARVAKLESDVGHIKIDISDIKIDIRQLDQKIDSNFKWLLTLMLGTFASTIAGIIVHFIH